jgi:hypothetical protein
MTNAKSLADWGAKDGETVILKQADIEVSPKEQISEIHTTSMSLATLRISSNRHNCYFTLSKNPAANISTALSSYQPENRICRNMAMVMGRFSHWSKFWMISCPGHHLVSARPVIARRYPEIHPPVWG